MDRWREWRESRAEQRAVVEEMRFHIERETERNLGMGMNPREARRAALKAFGGVDRFAEEARDERPGTMLSEFAISYLDWKLGARMLLKYPGLSVIGGVTLAAAIGIGAAWFELSMLIMYPELPLPDGDRIVRIENWDAVTSAVEPRALHDYHGWREQLASIDPLGAYRTVERNLITADGVAQPVQVAEISASVFPVTRVPPLLGRPLTEADEQPGAADVVVIGHDVWQRRFGGARGIIGREVRLGRETVVVVGVMPEGFGFPRNHQLWTPLRAARPAPRAGASVNIFGRLADGASLESAQAELSAMGVRSAAANPATHAHLRPRVRAFAAPASSNAARELILINLGAWLVLAAACANVAALMFARTAMRESEIMVRTALGASRMRVMGQLFTEALVLTSAAAVTGLTMAALVMRQYVFDTQIDHQRTVPFWWEAGLEPVTILYTAVLAVAGAGVVGLLPAIRATGEHVQAGLRRIATGGGTSMRFGGVWSALIVFQVGFSVLCLPFAIAAAHEALRERRLRAAFAADGFLTFRPELDTDDAVLRPSAPGDPEGRARAAGVIDELTLRLENEPGVAGVAVVDALPGTYAPLWRIEVQREAEPPSTVDTNVEGGRARIASVGIEYFETMRTPLVAGRGFRRTDIGTENRVVVINEALARNMGGSPTGVRIRRAAGPDGEPGPWFEIVGVARDPGLDAAADGEADFVYVPTSADDARFVVMRVTGDAGSFAPVLRSTALQVDPDLRLHDVLTLREVIRREDLPEVYMTLAGTGVVLLAIMLSAASLHALMSVAVSLRTREIGIRLAVGASPRALLSAIFRRAATQVGIGIVAGNVIAALLLSVMVEDVRAGIVVPPMLIGSFVMALVGLGSCLVPGRRALRVQPTEALKEAL